MEFYHQDRYYYNPDIYERLGLRTSQTKEKLLEYFLETMRDYGVFSNYSPMNFEITQSSNAGYMIKNRQTGEHFYHIDEFIYKMNSFALIRQKFLQSSSSHLHLIIDTLSQQSYTNRSSQVSSLKGTLDQDSIQENPSQLNESAAN